MYEKGKGIVVERPGKAVLKEVYLPKLGNETIVVKTKFSAISSGTEMNIYNGITSPLDGTLWYPLIPGYEGVGEIVYVGKDVKGFKIGERVMANNTDGYPDYCSAWGGQVEYIIKTKEMRAGVECVKIPDNVSYEKSVMVSLAAVAFKGMKRINIKKEDKVLIIGQGVIGLSALQLFKLKGVKVAVADLYESRLKISRKFADMTINTSKENLLDKVKEFTDGKLADIVFEATGNQEIASKTIDFCKDGFSGENVGRIHFQGYYPAPMILTAWHHWFGKSPTITMSCGHDIGRDKILNLISKGKFNARCMFTKIVNINDAPKAYEEMNKDKANILKILFRWEA